LKILLFTIILFFTNSLFSTEVVEIVKTVNSDRLAGDQFGVGVGISGNYAIVVARRQTLDENGLNPIANAGAAYIYERDPSTGEWSELQKLVTSDRAINDDMISADISGDYAVVGTKLQDYDENGGAFINDAGAAYVFKRDPNSGVWSEQQKIVAGDRGTTDDFGIFVAIDNTYIVVGARYENEDAAGGNFRNEAGSAYIYELNSGTGVWEQAQKIVASDRTSGDKFGGRLAISGNYVIVGAVDEDHDLSGNNFLNNAGSAYIFERSNLGVWSQVQKIVASDREANAWFGISVDVDEDYIVVGAVNQDTDENGANVLNDAGAAYIFKNVSGVWTEVQKIVASDRAIGNVFGGYLSINDSKIVIGAAGEDEDADGNNTINNAGAAYLFELNDQSGVWSEVKKIVASDRDADNIFGSTLSIDGKNIIVGTIKESEDENGNNTLVDAGAVYFYILKKPPTLTSFNINSVNNYGAGLSINIDDEGEATTLTFKYGTSSGNYTEHTPIINLTGDDIESTEFALITNLVRNQIYYFIAEATNSTGTTQSNEIEFSPLKNVNDSDSDGINDSLENEGPNNGDANFDGILDSEQSNVTSLLSNYTYVTIEIIGCDSIYDVSEKTEFVDNNFVFPLGQMEFKLPCSNAEVKLYFHGITSLNDYSYRKKFPDNTYKQFENAIFSTETIGGNQVAVVTLSLTDGGPGDYDGIVNGVIYDPGGPALPITANIPVWDWWWVLIIIPTTIYFNRKYSLNKEINHL